MSLSKKNYSLVTSTALAGLLALGLSGCQASAQVSTETPEPEPEPAAEPAPEAPPEDPSDVHIEGDHLTIDQKIHFANASDEILEDSNEILDHIAQALANHKEFATLHVIGHTDENGSHDDNQDLSERRAASVVKALESRGVTQKMDSKGVGETEPTCEEDTDECHEQNRRVEFVVEKAE